MYFANIFSHRIVQLIYISNYRLDVLMDIYLSTCIYLIKENLHKNEDHDVLKSLIFLNIKTNNYVKSEIHKKVVGKLYFI